VASVQVTGGFAEVRDNVMTVLADAARTRPADPASSGAPYGQARRKDGAHHWRPGAGIGRGITLEFAREGADVAINYRRDREAAEQTAAEVRELGRRTVVLQADVSDREASRRW